MTKPTQTNPAPSPPPDDAAPGERRSPNRATELLEQVALADPVAALDHAHVARFVAAPAAAEPGASRAGRIAILPMQGVLMPRSRSGWFGTIRGMDALRADLRTLAADPDVTAIVLDIDSPGGTVAGTVETAAEVRAAAAQKKVVAVANTLAASAAYWIASQASEFVAVPSADVGSIGVMSMHVDESDFLRQMGMKVTIVRSARFKADVNPWEPLSDEGKAWMQQRVDEAHQWFIRDVAAGRGVTPAKVREAFGEGRVVSAKAAKDAGMVDRVATFDQVIAGLVAARTPRRRSALAFD